MKYTNWLKNIKGYSEKTIEIYGKYALELECYNWDYLKMIAKYEGRSNSSKRLILSAIKSYYIFKGDKRATEIELPKRELIVPNYVSFEQYQEYMLQINRRTKMGYQKYVMIRLMFETGIRASELLKIRRSDIEGNRIKIHGKGNKERYVMISNWLENDVKIYLRENCLERLFPFGYKNLYSRIRRIDKGRNLTPHMFRHGFAKHCYAKGIQLYDISLSMGHNSIETTTKYINKNSEDVKIYTIF